MSTLLHKLIHYSQRATRILLSQGLRGLLSSVQRRTRVSDSPIKHQLHLLDLPEPFVPLRFPDYPMPQASVVVPIGQDIRLTHHCLAAILGQQGNHSYEVILVDACSFANEEIQRPRWEHVRKVPGGKPGQRAVSYNLAVEAARGEILIFLDDHFQVQDGWLDTLIDTFEHRADAGIVGSRVLTPDGRQLDAGGMVLENGKVCRCGYLDDPYRPELNFLQEIDYCSGICFAVRRNLFLDLGGFDESFGASIYLDIDLSFRVRQLGFSVYCQPFSKLVACDKDAMDRGWDGCSGAGSEEPQRALFAQRWKDALSQRASGTDSRRDEPEHPVCRRAFVVDYAIPTPDRDSGSLRLVNLFAILQEEGIKITFASMGLEAREPYLSDLQKRGIECLHKPYEDLISEHLRRVGARYDLVVLSHVETAAEHTAPARRWCPNATIVFDTVDLHFQRVGRQASIRKDRRIARMARRIERQELALTAKADTTLVVSEDEKSLLARAVPGANVRVVSNIHRIYGSAKPFEDRHDILFIGGFAHPPNTDAVLFFCQKVFPSVMASLPRVRLFVIGSDPPSDVAELAGPNVHILGYVPDIAPYMRNCRLSVAPLRFGAGVKGKINQSLAHGLPVVATAIAAEGMFLEDGKSVLIANDAQSFSEAVLRLYEDHGLWCRLSEGGLAVMEQHFSFAAAKRAVAELLAYPAPACSSRTRSGTGTLLS